MRSDRSRSRAAAPFAEILEPRRLFAKAGPLPVSDVPTGFAVSDIVADPIRDFVYVTDVDHSTVRVIDTDRAKQVATIALAGVPNELAVTPDASALIVTLAAAGKVQVVALPTFRSVRVIDVGVAVESPVVGAGNKLYAVTHPAFGSFTTTSVRQFDLATGAAGLTVPNGNEYGVILRVDRAGTHLYTRDTGLSGAQGVIEQFDISNPSSIPESSFFTSNLANPLDFYVDSDVGRVYTSDGAVHGVGTIAMAGGARADWYFDENGYGSGVTSYPHAPFVYGLSDSFVVQFAQATGDPKYHYATPGRPRPATLVATPNGRLMFVEDQARGFDEVGLGLIGAPSIGLSDGSSTITGSVFRDVNLDGDRSRKTDGLIPATVFVDVNGDGVWQDYGDHEEPSASVDGTGDGTFRISVNGLTGTYAVCVTGYLGGDSSHRPFQAGTAASVRVAIAPGSQTDGLKFGVNYGALLEGSAYYDDDGDGSFDNDDAGVYGRTVYLDLDNDGVPDAGEPTDDAGSFGFNVRPGTYTIRLLDDAAAKTTLTVASDRIGYAGIALAPVRTLSGTLFHDLDLDGRRDAGENAFAGARVWLDFDGDGRRDGDEPQATSAADGSYRLRSPSRGIVLPIRFSADAGKLRSTAHRKTVTFESDADAVTADFGLYLPPTLSITAYLDLDKNRKHSKGDRWLAYTIAFVDLDDDGRQDKNEPSAITDAVGRATFGDLPPGTYVVRLRVSSKVKAKSVPTLTTTLAPGDARAWSAAIRA